MLIVDINLLRVQVKLQVKYVVLSQAFLTRCKDATTTLATIVSIRGKEGGREGRREGGRKRREGGRDKKARRHKLLFCSFPVCSLIQHQDVVSPWSPDGYLTTSCNSHLCTMHFALWTVYYAFCILYFVLCTLCIDSTLTIVTYVYVCMYSYDMYRHSCRF